METYTDPDTGRPYGVDPVTGRSYWLDQPRPPSLQQTQELPVVPGAQRAPDGGAGPRAARRVPGGVATKALGAVVAVLIVLTALALVLSSRNGSGGASPSSTSPAVRSPTRAAPSTRAPSTRVTPRIGTAVRDGEFEFTVIGTRQQKTLGNDLVGTTANGQYLLVSVRIRNIGDDDKTFVALLQKVHDTAGQEYTADVKAAAYLGKPSNLLDRIGPGEALEGTLVFDVPSGARAANVELHDGPLSGGAEVALR